jgi:hypothetical protein
MKNNHTTAKPSLMDIKKSLNANQQLTTDMQCDLKGGCANCEDSRRPPRADGSIVVALSKKVYM